MNVDVMGHPVTSLRCSEDGQAILVSCLDGKIRMIDRADGRVLKGFGNDDDGGGGTLDNQNERANRAKYMNKGLRIRSAFAKSDSVVFSGGETNEETSDVEGHVFAWDVLSGELITKVSAGVGVRVVSAVAWNERGGCWAGACSDGTLFFS